MRNYVVYDILSAIAKLLLISTFFSFPIKLWLPVEMKCIGNKPVFFSSISQTPEKKSSNPRELPNIMAEQVYVLEDTYKTFSLERQKSILTSHDIWKNSHLAHGYFQMPLQ